MTVAYYRMNENRERFTDVATLHLGNMATSNATGDYASGGAGPDTRLMQQGQRPRSGRQ
jgi:hypothetical protein